MRQVDCERFIARDDPDGLVLAILCDFHGREPQAVVNHIFLRLHQLLGDNPKRLREYIDMLEILSDNRDLKSEIKEAENMLSQVRVERLPSYELGMERGIEQGLEQGKVLGAGEGQARMLLKQLRARFGELPDEIVVMVQAADTEQLELWGERILSAGTLEEIFAER
jgi:flagellar biosynthesis/type III secretory pathway protein FliH